MDTPVPRTLTMTRAEFRAWAEQQPRGRFERVDGRVVEMTPERAGHVLVKVAIVSALRDELRRAGIEGQAFGDGMTVEIDEHTDYEPDAMVNIGPPLSIDAMAAPNPLIVVAVLSPSTQSIDNGEKLAGYLRVPSIQHYLVVAVRRREVVHFRRIGAAFVSTVVTEGAIRLDPPGIFITMDGIYRDVAL